MSEREVAIAARGLTKSFGDTPVLAGVDLEIRRHEVVALFGPSGAGKSTALRCLNLLETPDDGTIELAGERVPWRSMDAAALSRHRARVGMVFQQFNLFGHLTVLGNVIEAPMRVLRRSREEAEAKARELLTAVGMGEREDAFPAQLSGGQQQRVAIARALAMDPDVLLLDEVTSALDVENIAGINRLLEQLAEQGMTMVMVTHDLGFARDAAHRLCFISDGRVSEEGPPDRLLDAPETDRLREFLTATRA
jgi:polar amino acid transport system ATP-binding protein